ncbi:alkaline phosphatase D family protein [Gloeobacter kilaueensis]|uniref:Alkaline phosphatase n=1 Tax=Gloeobacter kilaueensis (strain ATCC BAA-2537 / CCAP 1431/1 / ULC 316 / JS1) TaxID=1183438 RepID=U5QJF2_GLOK1|nr:alkaline phosphatase D family protein [Gloeobacter kilaueensis]AGY58998.1 alkaline phosphatase [Gloeobacter kilaueensis JS1]
MTNGQEIGLATSRRQLLAGAGLFVGLAVTAPLVRRALAAGSGPLFSLGVASGDPLPDGVVLWTRLAPEPLAGGGMPNRPVNVQWQVAKDERMRQIVRQGTVTARPEWGHSVHVEVSGLQPARWYWYRFKVGNEVSAVGRTRTAPAVGTHPARLRFAFASCQNYEAGYYAAYRDMAAQDLDFALHLGDYIYERGALPGRVRQHDGPAATSLEQYRNRYALYKLDADLQAAHAAFPWIVTWDDHEVQNNYAGLIPEDSQDPQTFRRRRAAAYQAYYEHMPLRRSALPDGASLKLYRRFAFGDLLALQVLDTRQYRSDQPCDDGLKPRCAAALAPEATMTGTDQERWLFGGLSRSHGRWNVIAQQTMMAQFNSGSDAEPIYNLDQWDGYVAARSRLLAFLAEARVANPVVLSGDIHSSWVSDLKSDFEKPESATVATEFTGTSISSDFPKDWIRRVQAALPANPHIRFFDGAARGYGLCTLERGLWRTDYRSVSDVTRSDSPVSTLAAFRLEAGQAGAKRL